MQLIENGVILLSREALKDPNFSATAVLICIHEPQEGTFGFVLNRPSHMPLCEVFSTELSPELKSCQRKIYIGGPVRQHELQLLHLTDTPTPNAYAVAPHVYLGGTWESLDDILNAESEEVRLFLGYSGWAAGQLESEIQQGAWEVYRCDLASLLRQPEEQLCTDVAGIRAVIQHYRSD